MEGLVWGEKEGAAHLEITPLPQQKWFCLLKLSDEGEIGDI